MKTFSLGELLYALHLVEMRNVRAFYANQGALAFVLAWGLLSDL